jgi:hypothetical protein
MCVLDRVIFSRSYSRHRGLLVQILTYTLSCLHSFSNLNTDARLGMHMSSPSPMIYTPSLSCSISFPTPSKYTYPTPAHSSSASQSDPDASRPPVQPSSPRPYASGRSALSLALFSSIIVPQSLIFLSYTPSQIQIINANANVPLSQTTPI